MSKNFTSRIRLKSFWIIVATSIIFVSSTALYLKPVSHILWSALPSRTTADAVTVLNPADASLQLKIGYYFFNHGAYDLDRAMAAYQRVLALDPDNRDAHYQLARIYFLKGDFFLAKHHIDRVLEIDPNHDKGYYMKGLILGYRGDLIEAAQNFEEFIRRTPYEWAGYNDLAWIHFQLGNYEKTLETTTRGLPYATDNAWLLNMHGLALMNLGYQEEAREYFDRAQAKAAAMQPADWGIAYPGNDPAIYAEGLERMREAIAHNLSLVQ